MNLIKSIFPLAAACLCVIGASAHDFSIEVSGQKAYFKVIDRTARTAEVTFNGTASDYTPCALAGVFEIPEKVTSDGVTYTVTAIGKKAFADAADLTGVIIPSTVTKIDDFAFENCPRLESVVFPSCQLDIKEGTFRNDTALRHLSFGSDWTMVDLKPYCWSDSLQTLYIPARVEKIRSLKKLPALRCVTVDPNNRRFSSVYGILYNKPGDVLYGVPRSYAGMVKVADGTTTINKGALIDCKNVTGIDFPATLKYVSFREFSQMPDLKEIIFRSEEAPVTAYKADASRDSAFVLQLANPNVVITVPVAAKKAYLSAICLDPAEYYEDAEGSSRDSYRVGSNQVPMKKNIKGVKSFAK